MFGARNFIIMLLIFDLTSLYYAFNNSNNSTRTCSSNLAPIILPSFSVLISLTIHNCAKLLFVWKDHTEFVSVKHNIIVLFKLLVRSFGH